MLIGYKDKLIKSFAISDKVILLFKCEQGFSIIEGRSKGISVATKYQPKAPAFNRFWNRVYTLALGPRAVRTIVCRATVQGFNKHRFTLVLLIGPGGYYICRHDSNSQQVRINHTKAISLMTARMQFADFKSHAKRCREYPWTGEWA